MSGNNSHPFGVSCASDMRLRLQLLITSVLVAIPIATAVVMAINALRARDAVTATERIASSFLTSHVRQACETDPNWFLAGPRGAPPSLAERALPDAEVRLPRPSTDPLPLEFYAYSDQYEATSTAGPRFPPEFKAALRSTPPVTSIHGTFETDAGGGIQLARATGWSPGPCSVLLFRLRSNPNHGVQSAMVFGGVFLACLALGAIVAGPTILRIGRLARATRESARQDYSGIVTAGGNDEVSSLGAMFNQIGADIRRRIADSRDREDALQRYVTGVTEGVAQPLADLQAQLASGEPRGGDAEAARLDMVRQTHALSARLLNLAAVARLRTGRERLTREPIDMSALVARVLAAREQLAASLGVTMTSAVPKSAVTTQGDVVLFERAIGNLVDNAILYNQRGGRVHVEIAQQERNGRFSLRITDTGRGVSDDEFTGLNAIRRFRGDEGRERRAGVPGLGLAVAREVAERFGFGLELRRPAAGGFEVEFAGTGRTE
jgi:signal transduction histidine kinase